VNWFEMVNKATKYIEAHITEDIILEDIAKECNVSYYYFVKTFTMITGYTLKEYIRNRRITLASYEVSNTQHRILDIALKYGYSSNESFSRAFKKIHGINNFKSSYPSKEKIYQVHYDLSEDFFSYNFFVGYDYNKYDTKDDLEVINISAKKAVSFISKGIDKKHIYDIKLIIYQEWEKNGFVSDLNCEIEYVIEKPQGKLDFFYIVSIN
jgi:AraC-like DNA-binding protein